MPAGRDGSVNEPSPEVYVWTDLKSARLSAMTRAFQTGRAALDTVPSTCSAAGSGASDLAGTATAIIAAVMAIARNWRIYPLRSVKPYWKTSPPDPSHSRSHSRHDCRRSG